VPKTNPCRITGTYRCCLRHSLDTVPFIKHIWRRQSTSRIQIYIISNGSSNFQRTGIYHREIKPTHGDMSGLWNMFTRRRVIRPAADGPSPPEPEPEPEREPTQYHPTVEDVLHAKSILLAIASFPLELIDTIIDVAEYWPCSTTLNTGRYRIRDVSWGAHGSGDHFLVSQVIPRLYCSRYPILTEE
jgi:hypothetical protein